MLGLPLAEIGAALGYYTSSRKRVAAFFIDSRDVGENGVFFALRGARVDGHSYLEEVARRGALAAVVARDYRGPSWGLKLLRVDSVQAALHTLAGRAFAARREKVVAITGSMGKTTTKEFSATLLEAKYRVFKTSGNRNTQLSLPLALLNLDRDYDVMVLEMGMSARGQIEQLAAIAPPDLAMVTRIAPAGIVDLVGGLKAVAEAKSEIFSQPRTRFGLIGAQAARFDSILYRGNIPKKIYGPEGDYRLWAQRGGVRVEDSPLLPLGFEASHLLENALGAIACARMFGLSWHEIGQATCKLKPVAKRFEQIEKEGVTFIQDSYNANPDSVVEALSNLPKARGRRLGVLGAMADLGPYTHYYHTLVGEAACHHLDQLLCIGDEARPLFQVFKRSGKPAQFFRELTEIREALAALVEPGDVVLIKGANALKLWTLLESH